MFGYIRVFENELKIKEYNYYKKAYCRLCRNIGSYSQTARLFLSYDMTFFSLLLDESDKADDDGADSTYPKCHKLTGNCKKACTDDIYQFTAAASIVLIYEKALDDIKDGGKLAFLLRAILSKGYKKASAAFPNTASVTRSAMEKYYELESAGSDAFTLAENFGSVMSELVSTADFIKDDDIKDIYKKIFDRIGAAVYLIDAADDIYKDKKSGNYNPILKFNEDLEVVRNKVLEYLSETEQLIELLSYRKSLPIIRNIIHYGMPFQLNKAINRE